MPIETGIEGSPEGESAMGIDETAEPPRDLHWLLNESNVTVPFAAMAEVAGVSPAVIREAVNRGEIPAVRIGSRRRIPRDAAIAYLQPLIDQVVRPGPVGVPANRKTPRARVTATVTETESAAATETATEAARP